MTRNVKVYYMGAAWFGVAVGIVGFNFTDWEGWLILGSYLVIAREIRDARD